jgi:hypothetical protein
MHLIDCQPGKSIVAGDAYRELAAALIGLTIDDVSSFRNPTGSQFAWHVRQAVRHLKSGGWLLETCDQMAHGNWALSEKGSQNASAAFLNGDDLLAEMMIATPNPIQPTDAREPDIRD